MCAFCKILEFSPYEHRASHLEPTSWVSPKVLSSAFALVAAVLSSLSSTTLIWSPPQSRGWCRQKGVASCFQIQVETPLSAKDSSPVLWTHTGLEVNYVASMRISPLYASSLQLSLLKAHAVLARGRWRKGGGLVTIVMCTRTHGLCTKHMCVDIYTAALCMWAYVSIFTNIEIKIIFIQHT